MDLHGKLVNLRNAALAKGVEKLGADEILDLCVSPPSIGQISLVIAPERAYYITMGGLRLKNDNRQLSIREDAIGIDISNATLSGLMKDLEIELDMLWRMYMNAPENILHESAIKLKNTLIKRVKVFDIPMVVCDQCQSPMNMHPSDVGTCVKCGIRMCSICVYEGGCEDCLEVFCREHFENHQC
jgi:hypothetical protein